MRSNSALTTLKTYSVRLETGAGLEPAPPACTGALAVELPCSCSSFEVGYGNLDMSPWWVHLGASRMYPWWVHTDPPFPGLPYVPMVGTGCTHGGYGILFFAGVAAGGIGERFAIPFLEISGWRMRPMSEIGETIARRDSATIVAEEAFRCLAEEAVVLVFGIPAHNRIFGFGADRFCRTATGQVRFPVVRSIVAQPPPQFDP